MSLIDYIGRQFHNPTGAFGRLATWIMNVQNRALYDATKAVLAPMPADKVLDVGFGNGWLLEHIAKRYGASFAVSTLPGQPRFGNQAQSSIYSERAHGAILGGCAVHGIREWAF